MFQKGLDSRAVLRVALYECERLQEHLRPDVHSYTGGYKQLLQRAFDYVSSSDLPMLQLTGFDIKAGNYPENVREFDGVLISGSLSGVYDGDPWVEVLLQNIRSLDSDEVKTCGISFGHQAIPAALGGRVGRNPKGSEVSVRSAKLTEEAKRLFRTDRSDFKLHYHHNDAVAELPPGFVVLASNNLTAYQALYKPHHFLTFCGHPEYSHNPLVLENLLEYDRQKMWVHEQLVEHGLETLKQTTDYEWILRQIKLFYMGALANQANAP